jgi:hypothetical protein
MTTIYKRPTIGISYFKAVIVIALAILMTGCNKDEEKSELVKIDRTLYPFLFDQGTHWIYEKVNSDPTDTVTVIRDSINVESITRDTLYPAGEARSYEYYTIKYFSSLTDSVPDEQLIGYVISRGLNSGGFLLLSSKKKGDKSMNAEIVNVSEEMKVENVVYKQVVKMKVLKDQYINDNYFFYYVDRVGIIKKEKVVNDTIRETWNLKRYTTRMFKVQ